MLQRTCDDCPYGGVKVSQRGAIDSPLVIVGNGPSVIEVTKGIAFYGPEKELLDKLLKHAGFTDLNIEPLYINAIECFAKDKKTGNKKVRNKEGNLEVIKGGKQKYKQAIQSCRNRLLDIIGQHDRQMIIVLGADALHAVSGDHTLKITPHRGTVIEDGLSEKGTFVIQHPKVMLIGGGSLKQYRADFVKAFDIFGGHNFCKYKEPKRILTLKTPRQVKRLARKLRKHGKKLITADIETGGFDFWRDEILEIGITTDGENVYIVPDELIIPELFENNGIWNWHNGKFDIKFLWYYGFKAARVNHDTMLMSYCMNEVKGIHDLEQVGSDWLGTPNYKAMLDKYRKNKKESYREIPAVPRRKYCAIDVALTHQLFEPMYKKICEDKLHNTNYHKLLIPGSEYLARLEWNGFLVDSDWVGDHYDDMLEELAWHQRKFQTLAIESWGKYVNTNSWQQLQKYLYGHLKLGHPNMSTDKDTLEGLPSHPCLEPLLRIRKLQKYLSTYILPCLTRIDPEGRMHPNFKLHGTKTGRLACSDINMQNIPRLQEVRGGFKAEEGKILIECDLSQAELRSLAQLSGDEELCRIYNSDTLSLHDEVTAEIFPEYVSDKTSDFDKNELKMRGKAVNFGIVYGRQAPSFVLEFGISMAEATRWITRWLDRFPKGRDFIQRCRTAVSAGETLVTVFGRKRRFGIITPERRKKLENEASNFPHQSTASDITLLAGIYCEPILRLKYDAKVVNTVHDCIVVEAWPKDRDAIIKLVTNRMIQIPRDWGLNRVPFESDAEVGTRWGHLGKHYECPTCKSRGFLPSVLNTEIKQQCTFCDGTEGGHPSNVE